MISRSITHYLQLGFLISHAGFAYAQDPVSSEYQKRLAPVRQNIVDKLKKVKKLTEDSYAVDTKRLNVINNKIKDELGSQDYASFQKKMSKHSGFGLGNLYRQQEKKYDKKRAALISDLEKERRLSDLHMIKQKLDHDQESREYILNKVNTRLKDPEVYISREQYGILKEDKSTPDYYDPSRSLDEAYESLERRFNRNSEAGNWEDWGSDSRISLNGRMIEFLDEALQQQLEKIDDDLEKNYAVSKLSLADRLKLGGVTTKPGGPMYSPLEPALSKRVAAYVVPRMKQVGSWWNRFTSNWFAKTPNRFAVMRPVRMPKLQQPRIVGPEIKNIDVYEQWK